MYGYPYISARLYSGYPIQPMLYSLLDAHAHMYLYMHIMGWLIGSLFIYKNIYS